MFNWSKFTASKQSGLLTILSLVYAFFENVLKSGTGHVEQIGSLVAAVLLSLRHTTVASRTTASAPAADATPKA